MLKKCNVNHSFLYIIGIKQSRGDMYEVNKSCVPTQLTFGAMTKHFENYYFNNFV